MWRGILNFKRHSFKISNKLSKETINSDIPYPKVILLLRMHGMDLLLQTRNNSQAIIQDILLSHQHKTKNSTQ